MDVIIEETPTTIKVDDFLDIYNSNSSPRTERFNPNKKKEMETTLTFADLQRREFTSCKSIYDDDEPDGEPTGKKTSSVKRSGTNKTTLTMDMLLAR